MCVLIYSFTYMYGFLTLDEYQKASTFRVLN